MNASELERRFSSLSVWERRGERAPHKPLLLLYALGRSLRGESRLIPFADVEQPVSRLLVDFGPPRRSVHPEYPFWWLQSDGVWEVRSEGHMENRVGHNSPKKSELIRLNAVGGLTPEVQRLLRRDPALVRKLAHILLDGHFPESVHEDILDATGLGDLPPTATRRDPAFRERVLVAYEWRCAVCSFDVRLRNASLGLDAAHIKWHQAGGPDRVENGLALCALHHKLFDRGAFTLTSERRVLLSEALHGSDGFHEILRWHGSALRPPQNPDWTPLREFIEWHRAQVFHALSARSQAIDREGEMVRPRRFERLAFRSGV